MYFQTQKVISKEEISRIVYHTLGLTNADDNATSINTDGLISIGKLDIFSVKDAIVIIMKLWVERMEKYIHLLQKENNPSYQAMYKTLVYERGFTFKNTANYSMLIFQKRIISTIQLMYF